MATAKQYTEAQKAILAKLLKAKAGAAAGEEKPKTQAPRPARNRWDPFPLTDVQQAYLAGRQGGLELGNIATHSYQEFDVEELDVARYERAWQKVIARHDALRSVVCEDGTQQVLKDLPPFRLKVVDLTGMTAEAKEACLLAMRREMSSQILPLGTWPFFDVRCSRIDARTFRLHMSIDGLLLDGSSFPILFSDIRRFYEHPELEPEELTFSFGDYVAMLPDFERGEEYRKSEQYWMERIPSLPPAPEFTLGKPLEGIEKPHFRRFTDRWSKEQWAVFEAQAAKAGVTPAIALLAAFAEAIRLWNRHSSFCLNISYFNRRPLDPQVGEILGDFTDIMLLACEFEPGSTLLDRARLMQKRFWQDMDHRAFNGVRVLRELMRQNAVGGAALMPVVFTNLLKAGNIEEGTCLDGRRFTLRYAVSQTPQVLVDLHVHSYDGEVEVDWDVVEEAFQPGQIDVMFQAFASLLHAMAQDESVWRLASPVRLPEDQRARHLEANATDAPVSEETLHGAFFRQAARTPDADCVISSGKRLTYAQLAGFAQHLAKKVASLGATRGELVAVLMEKGWEQAAATLGIMAAGCAYLPVSPSFPRERIVQILKDAGVKTVLAAAGAAGVLEGGDGGEGGLALNVVDVGDHARDEWDPAFSGTCAVSPDDRAYVIYTSGSTGKPKGVVIRHRGAVNTIADINRRFGVTAQDRLFAISELNFDLSVYDLFGAFAAGAAVVYPDADKTREPAHWIDMIRREGVTVWNSVPMFMRMFTAYAAPEAVAGTSLRLVLMSGDWIPLDLPDKIRALWPQAQPVSLGGATEASIWSNCYVIGDVDTAWKSIPYGRPLANQRFYILNDAMEECPDWVTGHLYIAGIGLAEGYYRDPEKTAKSFVVHPATGERLYRTGDLGRWRADGNMEFQGREDFQTKIGGHRIELGDVEAALAKCPGVKAAVAGLAGTPPESLRLVGYAVPEEGRALDVKELRNCLRGMLPDYMVPGQFVFLEELPLLPNGKLNRRALPVPSAAQLPEAGSLEGASETVKAIAGVWKEVLGQESIGLGDNFFALGGDSLMAVRLLQRLKSVFGLDLPVRTMFSYPTVSQLAEYIGEQTQDAEGGEI
ncbi:MAG: amino acid adenylation domain-containing protein [Desulfovibrio sp.]|nr:amino acid adenylation domain-containing protein [Desulfovibrio sp.]